MYGPTALYHCCNLIDLYFSCPDNNTSLHLRVERFNYTLYKLLSLFLPLYLAHNLNLGLPQPRHEAKQWPCRNGTQDEEGVAPAFHPKLVLCKKLAPMA